MKLDWIQWNVSIENKSFYVNKNLKKIKFQAPQEKITT